MVFKKKLNLRKDIQVDYDFDVNILLKDLIGKLQNFYDQYKDTYTNIECEFLSGHENIRFYLYGNKLESNGEYEERMKDIVQEERREKKFEIEMLTRLQKKYPDHTK